MKSSIRLAVMSLAFVGTSFLIACGDSAPTSPAGLATIRGSVNPPSATASAFSGSGVADGGRKGITVSVEGTGLSVTTDSQGQFVLSGVPTGSITLRFEGPGIDARLELSGLRAGQTLTLAVSVSGNRASLVINADPSPSPSPSASPSPSPSASPSPSPSPSASPTPSPVARCATVGRKTEVEGVITAKSASSIAVSRVPDDDDDDGGQARNFLCEVSSSTRIRKGNRSLSFDQLQIGGRVHVKGASLGMVATVCRVAADEIKAR